MKKFSLALLLAVNLFAAAPIQSTVQELSWPKGDSFLTFLEKNSIPLKLYYDLDSEDKEFSRRDQRRHLVSNFKRRKRRDIAGADPRKRRAPSANL